MKPLFVLLGVFGLLAAGTYFWQGHVNIVLAGNGAMAAMLLFTGVAHFAFTKGMMGMLPKFLPAKKAWVPTGVLELAAAVGLLIPALRWHMGWLLIAFFILILPGNIIAARQHLNYQTGTFDGPGLRYLWFRIPLQLFFIYWTFYFALVLPVYVSLLPHETYFIPYPLNYLIH